MAGGIAAAVTALIGRSKKLDAKESSFPTEFKAHMGTSRVMQDWCPRVSWETGQSLFSHKTCNEDVYYHPGGCWVMLRLHDVETRTSFPQFCNGLLNVFIEGKIVSQLIFHKLNTPEEREHAYNHLYGLRLRLKLTEKEARSYNLMLDCVQGKAGIVPLDKPLRVREHVNKS
jgi:hypothetical protein